MLFCGGLWEDARREAVGPQAVSATPKPTGEARGGIAESAAGPAAPGLPPAPARGMGKAPSPGVGKGAVRVCYHSPAGLTGAFLVTVRETVSSSTASAGSSLAITT